MPIDSSQWTCEKQECATERARRYIQDLAMQTDICIDEMDQSGAERTAMGMHSIAIQINMLILTGCRSVQHEAIDVFRDSMRLMSELNNFSPSERIRKLKAKMRDRIHKV
jgi:hypothetical protein